MRCSKRTAGRSPLRISRSTMLSETASASAASALVTSTRSGAGRAAGGGIATMAAGMGGDGAAAVGRESGRHVRVGSGIDLLLRVSVVRLAAVGGPAGLHGG